MPKFPTLFHLPSWRTFVVGLFVGYCVARGVDWCLTFYLPGGIGVRETFDQAFNVGRR